MQVHALMQAHTYEYTRTLARIRMPKHPPGPRTRAHKYVLTRKRARIYIRAHLLVRTHIHARRKAHERT